MLRRLAMTDRAVIARNVAISVFRRQQAKKREIASQARNDKMGEIASQARNDNTPVIARNVAISVFAASNQKREIASQARNDRQCCHREERGDLGFPEAASKKKRDCFAGSQ